jgi:hypothetical protein
MAEADIAAALLGLSISDMAYICFSVYLSFPSFRAASVCSIGGWSPA